MDSFADGEWKAFEDRCVEITGTSFEKIHYEQSGTILIGNEILARYDNQLYLVRNIGGEKFRDRKYVNYWYPAPYLLVGDFLIALTVGLVDRDG